MVLAIAVEEGLGVEHVHQATQTTGQHDLAWGIILALYPSTQTGQEPHLFPFQCNTQFVEEASGNPGQSQERTDTLQV